MESGIRVNYRKLAFDAYEPMCAICGFGVKEVLEVAHLDCDHNNNNLTNLAILCPNCHKMHDLDVIPTSVAISMRNWKKKANWKKRMGEAGRKAAETRRKKKLSAVAKKAAITRRKNERLAMGTATGR